MAKSLISAGIKFSTRQAKQAMFPAIAQELNTLVNRNIKKIKTQAQLIIEEEIKNHDTYKSLISDDPEELRGELGIENAYSKIQSIINIWIRSLELKLIPVHAKGTRLSGGFTLQAIRKDFQDVINLEEAHHLAEFRYSPNIFEMIPDIRWLEWLLIDGFDMRIHNFEYTTDIDTEVYQTGRNRFEQANRSRTGLGVMKLSKDGATVWMVPARHAGTIDDNWITQAMEDAAHKIQSVIAILIKTEVSAPATFR